MEYKLTIHCTREHLEKAQWCSASNYSGRNYHKDEILSKYVSTNCWIALAVQDIFPFCDVFNDRITNYTKRYINKGEKLWSITLPYKARVEISIFDKLLPKERLETLKPFSFDIIISQRTFETILECNGFSFQQFKDKCVQSKTLELVEI